MQLQAVGEKVALSGTAVFASTVSYIRTLWAQARSGE